MAVQTAFAAYYSACKVAQGNSEALLEALEPVRSKSQAVSKNADSIPGKNSIA